MKRLISAAVITVIAAVVMLIGFSYIKTTCNTSEKLLRKCDSFEINNKELSENANKLKEYWEKRMNVLSIFANHSEIEEIEYKITSLCTFAKENSKVLYDDTVNALKELIAKLSVDGIIHFDSVV